MSVPSFREIPPPVSGISGAAAAVGSNENLSLIRRVAAAICIGSYTTAHLLRWHTFSKCLPEIIRDTRSLPFLVEWATKQFPVFRRPDFSVWLHRPPQVEDNDQCPSSLSSPSVAAAAAVTAASATEAHLSSSPSTGAPAAAAAAASSASSSSYLQAALLAAAPPPSPSSPSAPLPFGAPAAAAAAASSALPSSASRRPWQGCGMRPSAGRSHSSSSSTSSTSPRDSLSAKVQRMIASAIIGGSAARYYLNPRVTVTPQEIPPPFPGVVRWALNQFDDPCCATRCATAWILPLPQSLLEAARARWIEQCPTTLLSQ
jgi:hypothetical protein